MPALVLSGTAELLTFHVRDRRGTDKRLEVSNSGDSPLSNFFPTPPDSPVPAFNVTQRIAKVDIWVAAIFISLVIHLELAIIVFWQCSSITCIQQYCGFPTSVFGAHWKILSKMRQIAYFIVLFLFASIAGSFEVTYQEYYQQHWQTWKSFYGKTYGSETEEEERFAVWNDNLRVIVP